MSDIINEIKQRISIIDLASRINLKISRSGNRLWVYSIFRDERTPSMLLDTERNTYHDFGNGEHGDVIDLYMNYYQVEKRQAIEDLRKMAGLEKGDAPQRNMPRIAKGQQIQFLREYLSEGEKQLLDYKYPLKQIKLFRIKNNSQVFNEFYNYCISQNCNLQALEYLMAIRKISWDSIHKFRIFTIGDYNKVNNYLKKQFRTDKLQRAGLYNEHGNLIFYKHRIIIPYIFEGKMVYLRGRYFDEDQCTESSSQKYLGLRNDMLDVNSPKRFYNVDTTKEINAGNKLYITEGEFDSIVIEQLGFHSVGIPGAGNIPDIEKFRKFAAFNLVYAGDNDKAGKALLTGNYEDINGNYRYKENNLADICHKLKIRLYQKQIPAKDINDFLVSNS